MKKLIKNFFKCGLTGWCMEIIYTSLLSLRRREFTLKGQTSLWMFPIYGSACFLTPLFRLVKMFPSYIRGSIYAVCIFTGEYLTGRFLTLKKFCPWNYGRSRWNIKEVVRLDYFPNWFLAGLLFERLLAAGKSKAV
ncbi:MAG: hypothetical protein J6C64_03840 [Lachnospiraceae bacterium]|nr:hypothetical protein [Lachnospiraceae bacterium]